MLDSTTDASTVSHSDCWTDDIDMIFIVSPIHMSSHSPSLAPVGRKSIGRAAAVVIIVRAHRPRLTRFFDVGVSVVGCAVRGAMVSSPPGPHPAAAAAAAAAAAPGRCNILHTRTQLVLTRVPCRPTWPNAREINSGRFLGRGPYLVDLSTRLAVRSSCCRHSVTDDIAHSLAQTPVPADVGHSATDTTVGSRRRDPPSHHRLCEVTVPSDPSVTINVQYTARYNHDHVVAFTFIIWVVIVTRCSSLLTCGHNDSRIICPWSTCIHITLKCTWLHQSSCIVVMHIMPLLKVIDVTSEQNPWELSVL